jgi:hypothetical protein
MAEKIVIPEPYLSQLNAAYYKQLLAESRAGHAERNLIDAKNAAQAAGQAKSKLAQEVATMLGVNLMGWSTETGVVQVAEPVAPPADAPPAETV